MDDAVLVQRYIAGDEAAFEELMTKYQSMVYGLAYRLSGSAEDAQDIAQKAFINAFRGIGGFRGQSSFKTWIYSIAVNAGMNHLRKRALGDREVDETIAGNERGVLAAIVEREKQDIVRQGLARLPERQRTAVVLRAYEGLSNADAGKIMGCSEGAVKSHYHLGVRRLRELIRESGYEL